jgi:GcrA cell cycle regulator
MNRLTAHITISNEWSMPQPSHSILPTWTPERERRALRLYLREGLTAAEVADVLGCGVSRAAVIGKVRRLGYLKRDACAGKAGAAVVKKAVGGACRLEHRLPPLRPPLPLPLLREAPPTGAPLRLACLPSTACRWPIDDPGPGRMHAALFCAGPAPDGTYCAAHRALAHRR